MSASEPTLPGAFPETPAGASNEPDPFIEAAKSYAHDLSEKTKPYLPEVVTRHLPEHEIKAEANPGSNDENGKHFNQGGGELSLSKDDRGQQLEEKERIIRALEVQDAVPATNSENQDDDENIDQSDKVIPVDPDAQSRPKDDVAREQEREMEETSPSIFISNRHLSGSERKCRPAAHNNVELKASAGSLPISEGVAEDQLLADYLGPHEPTVSAEHEGKAKETSTPNGSTTPAQFEPRVRDFAVEEEIARVSIDTGESEGEPTVVIDSINEPYKPHRLENIQEKTRDNRLPPLASSPSTSTPPSPDASYRSGTGSALGKFIRGRRSSSSASKDDPSELKRRSTSTPSHGDSEQETDRPLEGIHEGIDSTEQTKREDPGDSPQSPKVGLMTKVKGEFKVAMGILQRNKEKVEEGKRMIENR